MKRDNSTLALKVKLRHSALREIPSPVVMESHGGYGRLWYRCYQSLPGIVFEKDSDKASHLARQRPNWAVYECDCVMAIGAGVGSHLPVNLLDVDAYGEPWPAISAYFSSERVFPERMVVVVTDGLRQKLKMGGGWDVASMQGPVAQYGNAVLYDNYLLICKELLQEQAVQVGYVLDGWAGYYCGYMGQMTHYAAVFVKPGAPASSGTPGDVAPT